MLRVIIQYLLMLFLLFILPGCTNLFFQPMKKLLVTPEEFNIEYENVYVKTQDNINLHGWWFPTATDSKASILFLHGNGENISTHASAVYWLTKHAYDVFIIDYRGYGKSEGIPDLEATLADIKSVFDYVWKRDNGDKKFFVIGHSLGASLGLVALSGYKHSPDGMLFVSPFSEYRQMAQSMMSKSWLTWAFQWPLSLTVSNEYSPIDYVDKLPSSPALFLYSEDDNVIPIDHVMRLFQKAHPPKHIEQISGPHNELFGVQENKDIILQYLDHWAEN